MAECDDPQKTQEGAKEMNINEVMSKYSTSVDDVLNVWAIYGGTVTIAPDECLEDVHHRGQFRDLQQPLSM